MEIAGAGCARYIPDEETIYIYLSERTYQQLRCHDGVARFTTVHEVGHVAEHAATLVELSEIPHVEHVALYRHQASHRFCEDVEWQADGYSAAALMPAKGLASMEAAGELSVRRVMDQYGVSSGAAVNRLRVFHKWRTQLL
jgi:hypothetical protein